MSTTPTDVSVTVALLRREIDRAGLEWSYRPLLQRVLVTIEAQAKALSEAEAKRAADIARLKIQRDNALLDMEMFMKKTEAAEARLAEAMKVIEPFASRDMSDINDCVDNYMMSYQSQWFADATAAARTFLAKEPS